MIDLVLRIPSLDWTVFFHFAVTCYHTDLIVRELESLGAEEKYVERAHRLLANCTLDEGLTFTSRAFHESVVVVELTSSAAEFQNSLQHEIRHLVDDLSIGADVTEKEELGYLTGEINYSIFPYICELLCDDCRRKNTHYVARL